MAVGFAVGLSHLSRCHVSRLYVFWQLTLVTAVTLMPQASVTAESLLQSGIDNCCHVCHAVTLSRITNSVIGLIAACTYI